MKKVNPLTNSRGMSLLEVMLASLLLVAVLAPITGMFVTANQGCTRSGQDTIALNLGRACMEKHLAQGYDELIRLTGEESSWQPCAGFPGYEYRVAVAVYDAGMEVLSLAVKVRPAAAGQGEVELATLVARWP